MIEQLTLPGSVRPIVIGIGGCSGSGKTSLAQELVSQMNATLLPLDVYYNDLAHQPLHSRHTNNFDAPESLDQRLIVDHVSALADGRSVARPVYDFATHTRVAGQSVLLQPAGFVVVEGILALHLADLLPLYTLRVYVDAPHEVCLARRVYRDVRERGRTEQSVHEQFRNITRPMAELYVIPSQRNADLTVAGTESLDWSIEAVRGALRDRGLLGRGGHIAP